MCSIQLTRLIQFIPLIVFVSWSSQTRASDPHPPRLPVHRLPLRRLPPWRQVAKRAVAAQAPEVQLASALLKDAMVLAYLQVGIDNTSSYIIAWCSPTCRLVLTIRVLI